MNQPVSTAQDTAVHAEQIDLLYRPLLLSVGATVMAAALFVAAQWRIVDGTVLTVWILWLFVVTGLRTLLALFYRRHRGLMDIHSWGRLFMFGAFLAGLVWGAGGALLFPPQNLEHQIIAVLVIVGMCSGATTTLSVIPLATYLFLVPAMLPVTLRFFVQGHEISLIISAMLLLSFSFFISAARNTHRNTEESIRLRLAAEHNERSLMLAKREAEKASQAKSDFLANVGHETRTPMNVILGMIHMVLQTGLNDTQRGYLRKAQRAAESLLGIIDDMLDYARADSDMPADVRMPFGLDRVLSELRGNEGDAARAKGLAFAVEVGDEVPDRLLGDAASLVRVLHSLAGNAVKFTRAGRVVVRVTGHAVSPERVRLTFSVSDTGPGIDPAEHDALFQPFSQADASRTRSHGGTGMGLAVAAKLVRRLGGGIRVDSEPGKGSTFAFDAEFDLDPAADEAAGGLPAVAAEPASAATLPRAEVDRAALGRQLTRLRDQIEAYDVDAEHTLRILAPLLTGSEGADALSRIERAIRAYDFDGGRAALGDLERRLGIAR